MGWTWICLNDPDLKRLSTEWEHCFSGKENVPGIVVSKSYADTFLLHEETYHYWFQL